MPDTFQDQDFTSNIVDNFLGGVNSFVPPDKIADNFMVKAQNAIINENGVLTRRDGLTNPGTLTDSASTVARGFDMIAAGAGAQRKLYVFYNVTSATENMRCAARDSSTWHQVALYTLVGVGFNDIGLSWVRESDGSEFVYLLTPFTSQRKLSVTNDGATPVSTTLDSATNSLPPRGTALLNAFGRIWAAGSPAVADRDYLFYTAFAPVNEIWDQDQFNWPFGTVTGQQITAIARYKNNMIFVGQGTSTSLFVIGGGDILQEGQEIMISNDIGVGSAKSIANAGEDLIFMDQNGDVRSLRVQLTESGSIIKQLPISIQIKDQTKDINQADMYIASGAYFRGNYWFSFKKDDGTFKLYTYNLALGAWTGPHIFKNASGTELQVHAIRTGWGDLGTADVSPGNRGNHLYFLTHTGTATTTALQVYELDSSVVQDEAATAIDLEVITKANDFGFPHQDKEYRWGEISLVKKTGASGSIVLYARSDYGDWIKIGTFDYTTGLDIIRHQFSLRNLARGRTIQFKITCSDTNTQPEISRLIVNGHAFDPRDG